jgi:hypothetical protein
MTSAGVAAFPSNLANSNLAASNLANPQIMAANFLNLLIVDVRSATPAEK